MIESHIDIQLNVQNRGESCPFRANGESVRNVGMRMPVEVSNVLRRDVKKILFLGMAGVDPERREG